MPLPTKLFHYCPVPFPEIQPHFHIAMGLDVDQSHKPYGIWVSVEDYEDDQNWKTWCESEKFTLEGLKYRYAVKIKPESKILHITNTQELEAFSLKYASKKIENGIMTRGTLFIYLIDWKDIKSEYDGIIIAPYNWECRLMNPTTSWYYSWDCASGCIWNYSCVEIELDSIDESIKTETQEECQEGEIAMD